LTDPAEALSGRAGGRGVRALLRSPLHREALRSMLEPGVDLDRCRLKRVKFKPGRKLTASYEVGFAGSRRGVRAATVTWTVAPAAQAMPEGEGAAQAMEQEARDRNLVAPFSHLREEVAGGHVRVQVTPLDPAFAHLVRLADPNHVETLLADVAGRSGDGSLPTVRTIRFNPGQRHVLRYQVPAPSGRGTRTLFAKLERTTRGGEEAGAAATGAPAVAGVLAGHSRLAAATPLARVADDRVVLYELVRGHPLTRLLAVDAPLAGSALGEAGKLLAVVHAADLSAAAALPSRDHRAEVAATRRACEHIVGMLPHLSATITGVLARVGDRLDEPSAEEAGLAHGDFKADHLLVTPERTTLIDFDSCACAEPASDLGKFLADLRIRFFLWDKPGLPQVQQRFLDGYGPADPGRLARARLWEALLLVKLAARRVRVDDVDWATRTSMLVGEADRLARGVTRAP